MKIVYIDIDSCRPDHLGCYGYHRHTSPHIDALAKAGVRFDQYYTTDAPCLPSRTAMYSGRFGIQTGVVGHGGSAAQPKIQGPHHSFRDWFSDHGLAQQLQRLGMHTTVISPFGQRHAAHWFYAGMHEVHNTGKGGMESAEEVWPAIDQWLANNVEGRVPRKDWFLHINFWDPHTPYRVPLDFGEPFKNTPMPKFLNNKKRIAQHARKTGPHSAMDLGMYEDNDEKRWPRSVRRVTNLSEARKWIDGYDTGVLYADLYIGKIIERLNAAGSFDETYFIVSGDHGENQGELGLYGEHATADAGTCRIPMVIKGPGIRKGVVDYQLRYNIDLAPTLMELLGGKCPDIWDGKSFAAALKGKKAPGHEELIFGQCAHVCQRSVRYNAGRRQWLYIRTYHDGFHLFPEEMLFDLASDPHEEHNLTAKHPQVCREAIWRMERWHARQMQTLAERSPHDVVDPLWTVMAEGGPAHALHTGPRSPLPQYIKRLEETGRKDGAEKLRAKYARWLKT